jgi:hypothetical protein
VHACTYEHTHTCTCVPASSQSLKWVHAPVLYIHTKYACCIVSPVAPSLQLQHIYSPQNACTHAWLCARLPGPPQMQVLKLVCVCMQQEQNTCPQSCVCAHIHTPHPYAHSVCAHIYIRHMHMHICADSWRHRKQSLNQSFRKAKS